MSAPYAASGTETDQFTTPATRLYDIGPALSRRIVEIIESDDSGATPEAILSNRVGRGLLTSRVTKWAKRLRNEEGPVTFRPRVFASIYRTAAAPMPASFWFDAPTVNVHGYYMGTDKIDHFFQQGLGYYKLIRRREAGGAGPAAAVAAAVARGVRRDDRLRRGFRPHRRGCGGGCAGGETGADLFWDAVQRGVFQRRPGGELCGHEVLSKPPSHGDDWRGGVAAAFRAGRRGLAAACGSGSGTAAGAVSFQSSG
jgi:hypothetical protein